MRHVSFTSRTGPDRLIVQERVDLCEVFHLPAAKGMTKMAIADTFENVVARLAELGWLLRDNEPDREREREAQRLKDQAWVPPVRPPKKTGMKNLEVAKNDAFTIDNLPEAPR